MGLIYLFLCVVEMNIREGKGGRCFGLTTLPPPRVDCLDIWEPQPLGNLRDCPGPYSDCFIFRGEARTGCLPEVTEKNLGLYVRIWQYVTSVRGATVYACDCTTLECSNVPRTPCL